MKLFLYPLKALGVITSYFLLPIHAFAEDTSASPVAAEAKNGYLILSSTDGNYELKLDGRVQLDFGAIDSDKNPDQSDTNFRRIRFGIKTKLWKEWQSEFDVDFAGSKTTVKDMWLAYTGVPHWNFKVGNFKPHFSIDQVSSSRVATFMEASIATDAIATSRRIGAATDYSDKLLFVGGGFFGDKVNDATDTESKDNPDGANDTEKFGYSFRGVLKPYFDENANNVFHIGINYLNQKPRSIGVSTLKDNSFKFSVVAENELDETEYLDTGRMYGADHAETQGVEIAAKYNKHIVVAEYLKTTVQFKNMDYTANIPDANFDGYYVAYSYFINGSRRYDTESAEFAGITGKNALEVTARYSTADFNDPMGGNSKKRSATIGAKVAPTIGLRGGEANIFTLGMNWYPNANLMLRVNYMMIELDKDADANAATGIKGGDNINVLGTRIQFTF